MSRLTEKYATKEGTTIGMPRAVSCYWKLKEYEDIEEEFGIDLITLFKALKNGVRFTHEEEIKPVQLRMFHEEPMLVHKVDNTVEEEVYVKQHGITWKELL